MCNLSQGISEAAHTDTTLSNIRSIVRNLKMPVRDAMAALDIPASDYPKYLSLLSVEA